MKYTYTNKIDAKEYDEFVKVHPQCNLLQSSSWRKIKNTWGNRLVGLRDETNQLVAAGLVLLRPVKFGWTVWYMPRGPLMNYEDKEVVEAFFAGLKQDAKKNKGAFIKIDPPVFANLQPFVNFEEVISEDAMKVRDILESVGFTHQGFTQNMHDTIQPRYQAITYKSEEPIANRLSKRAKKEVKDSVKKMVEVERIGQDRLDEFCYLIEKTEESKDINLRDEAYFQNMLNTYGDDCMIYIAFIDLVKAIDHYSSLQKNALQEIETIGDSAPKKKHRLEEQLSSYDKHLRLFTNMQVKNGNKALIAGAITVVYGLTADILYAGFNRDFKGTPGQDPVFLKSIEAAFEKGAISVNMGGVENSLQDGLMEYKKNFDPHVAVFLGEFDMPVSGLMYKAYQLLMKIRKR